MDPTDYEMCIKQYESALDIVYAIELALRQYDIKFRIIESKPAPTYVMDELLHQRSEIPSLYLKIINANCSTPIEEVYSTLQIKLWCYKDKLNIQFYAPLISGLYAIDLHHPDIIYEIVSILDNYMRDRIVKPDA